MQLTLQEKQSVNFGIAVYLSLIILPFIISSVFGWTAYECFAIMIIQGIIFLALRNTFEWIKGAIFLIETYRLQIFTLALCFFVLDLLFWYKTEQSVFLDGIWECSRKSLVSCKNNLSKLDVWNLNQRAPLVYAGGHNGTHVAVYGYNRPPCVQKL